MDRAWSQLSVASKIFEICLQKLINFSKLYKRVLTFPSLQDLLENDNPDLLIISTPSGIHYKKVKKKTQVFPKK